MLNLSLTLIFSLLQMDEKDVGVKLMSCYLYKIKENIFITEILGPFLTKSRQRFE